MVKYFPLVRCCEFKAFGFVENRCAGYVKSVKYAEQHNIKDYTVDTVSSSNASFRVMKLITPIESIVRLLEPIGMAL